MYFLILLTLLAAEGFLLKKYLYTLGKISEIDFESRKLLNAPVSEESITVYKLLSDFRFFILLVTKSYAKSGIGEDLVFVFSNARRYLLLQYPVMTLLFLTPVFFSKILENY